MIRAAYADGGEIGANGTSTPPGLTLIGGIENGDAAVGSDANGGGAADVTGKTLTILGTSDSILSITGDAGASGGSYGRQGGNGVAGNGGGSVFGGISTGGAAGYSSESSANGGSGGDVSDNQITLTKVDLDGSNAIGGTGGSLSYSYGGNGVAGNGGGSVFGGISTGGAGGTTSDSSANGGNGGDVSGNQITLKKVDLDGSNAIGGAGGNVQYSSYGGGGAAGHGGGSVFGGISTGGAVGSSLGSSANGGNGGNGGNVTSNTIEITESTLTGAAGGKGGDVNFNSYGGYGAAGHGGGSVFGGISTGGAAGYSSESFANGGNGGDVSDNQITLTKVDLDGSNAIGGAGGITSYSYSYGGGSGAAGHGGGSVFGGISTGGAAGYSPDSSANGGNGGNVTGNTIEITESTLTGAVGGEGGSSMTYGGGGGGGHGGGSVFGGISTGGAGGSSFGSSANGGSGGDVSDNQITLTKVDLDGSNAIGGTGGSRSSPGGGGAAGHGGGSVFGGISTGGAGGSSFSSSANGGNGGNVTGNTIEITESTLTGAAGGAGGNSQDSSYGGSGAAGYGGGSVFGGISTGGAGGSSSGFSANGGNGGDVSGNQITIYGVSNISGDIYGGISQGGDRGNINSKYGQGGQVQNNIITLIGTGIEIGGSIVGGLSRNGDGSVNDHKAFSGNTLILDGYKGKVQGIVNIENYKWTLPEGVFNGSTIIEILGTDNVKVDNTIHTIAMYNDGKRLNEGDTVVMISKADGTAAPRDHRITQGHFLQYDAVLETIKGVDDNNNPTSKLVLTIDGKEDSTPVTPPPGGDLQESSEKFLVSRLATMATLNRGTDMLADLSEEACRKKLFGVVHGGSHRSNTGEQAHINVNDVFLTFGGATCFELQSKSTVMLGGFVQHGRSNYDSYNYFDERGDVYGWGKVQYTGVGLLFEMNVAETGTKGSAPVIGSKDGLHLNAALRAGQAKTRFLSTLSDTQGVQGKYDSTSPYVTAMVGAGYAWKIDEKRLLDFYGRYTFAHLSSDTVMIGKDQLSLETIKSSRLRLGARYHYAVKEDVKPYVGVALEHEFMGHAYGSAYNMSIHSPSLKGSSGLVEVGVSMKPSKTNKAWTVNMGVQGTLGDRRGFSGGVALKYEF